MSRMKPFVFLITILSVFAEATGQSKGKLFFREDWKEIKAAIPVTGEHVSNADLELHLYGPASTSVKKSNHPEIPNDPFYIWSGECRGNWAVGLSHQTQKVDLSGADARIVIRCRQTGFRQLRIIVKGEEGNWLVSEQSAGVTDDWTEKEFRMREVRWRKLNIETVSEAARVTNPDLKNIVEIGFTDLMSGGGTPASSRLDWIEVWGLPKRK